ncbi:MAG: very short patch repair endonuclease [Geobacteraceae bacterium]|nr:very short patch repair endonuclease [Geobacteraceae bacterium]
MSKIKGRNTKPELLLRKELFKKGFRYRLHDKKLPGKPDIVFRKFKAVVLINGCFWHGHSCSLFRLPKTNHEFWRAKIGSNKVNDAKNVDHLVKDGWKVVIVWECSMRGSNKMATHILIDIVSNLIVNAPASSITEVPASHT